MVCRCVFTWLVGMLALSASISAAAPVPPGSQIELLPVAGGSFFASSVVASPDGAHVYVAESAQLWTFERDTESGMLDPVGTVTPESGGTEALDGIVALAVSPDGAFVYVVTMSSHGILVFERDAQTGALATPPLTIDMTVTPSKIVFSPEPATRVREPSASPMSSWSIRSARSASRCGS